MLFKLVMKIIKYPPKQLQILFIESARLRIKLQLMKICLSRRETFVEYCIFRKSATVLVLELSGV